MTAESAEAGRGRLIANPSAGQAEAGARLVDVSARLRTRVPALDIVITTGEGDAEDAAEDAARQGYSHVFAAGGDGTLNEVVNGVLRVPDALVEVTFGVVPLGTGNDFARALGLTADVDAAVERLVAGTPRQVDVAWLEDRAFVNSSAGGLLAEASERVGPGLKTLAGRLAYLIGGAQTAWEYEPPVVCLELDGARPVEVRVDVMVVANARTIGGGYALTPGARIDDGLLEVLVIRQTTLANLTKVLLGMARGDTEDDSTVWRASVRELTFSSNREIVVNTDGAPRRLTHGRYRLQPRAARFLC